MELNNLTPAAGLQQENRFRRWSDAYAASSAEVRFQEHQPC